MNPHTLKTHQRLLLALSFGMAASLVLAAGLCLMALLALRRYGLGPGDAGDIEFQAGQFTYFVWPALALFYMLFSSLGFGTFSRKPAVRLSAVTLSALLLLGCLYAEWVVVDAVTSDLTRFFEIQKGSEKK